VLGLSQIAEALQAQSGMIHRCFFYTFSDFDLGAASRICRHLRDASE
jgi:hypothetical protein